MRLLWLFILVLLPTGLAAQSTDYGKVRLLKGWQLADGSYQIALEFDLNPGWKTYWRAPGSGGLPPQLTWNGSQNIAGVDISWPRPEIFETAGVQSIGYSESLVLPIRIMPQTDAPVRIALSLQFGVCSDICIPAEAVFLTRLDGTEPEGKQVIEAALRDLPQTADYAGMRDILCTITPSGDDYEITVDVRFAGRLHDPVSVIEYDSADAWVAESTTQTSGRNIRAVAQLSWNGSGPMVLNRDDIRLTVLGRDRAVEVQGCSR